MNGDILVLAQHDGGEPDSGTLVLLGQARALAGRSGVEVSLLLLGHSLEPLAGTLAERGAHTLYMVDDPELGAYNPELYSKVVHEAVRQLRPGLVLMAHTHVGMEVGPAVATRLRAAFVSNCLALGLTDDGALRARRPVFGNTLNALVELPADELAVVTMARSAAGDSVFYPSARTARVEVDVDALEVRTRVLAVNPPPAEEVDISKADIVVAIGRGIGSRANLPLAEALARALGAALGCSRPLVDMGWLPPEHQVGESGKTVCPKVYIACGISGAQQHVAGMRESQTIIAIDQDPEAPIFRIADFGVVGDLMEVLPQLVAEAEQRRRAGTAEGG